MRQLLKSAATSTLGRRLAASLLGERGSPIFMFHRVLPDPQASYDPEMVTSVGLFDSFLNWASEKFRIVPVHELLQRNGKASKNEKPLCALTFDDGWQDNYAHALPILKRYQAPATLFLANNMIGTHRRFWQERLQSCLSRMDRSLISDDLADSFNRHFLWFPPLTRGDFQYPILRRILLRRTSEEAEEFVDLLEERTGVRGDSAYRPFLNWEEVHEMRAAGVRFGSHTLNHTLLTRAAPDVAWAEITGSRKQLEERLGEPVAGFTYPWGETTPRITAFVQEAGFRFALTTRAALTSNASPHLLLPRIPISGNLIADSSGSFSPELAEFRVNTAAVRSRPLPKATRGNGEKPERLRIAIVIDRIWDWKQGGTERQLSQIIAALDREYFEPELFVLQSTQAFQTGTLEHPAHLIGGHHGSLDFHLIRNLKHEFERFRPHIVQTFFMDSTLAGTFAARMAGAPIIVQGRRSLGYSGKPLTHRLLLRVANRMTARWQCNSSAVAAFVRQEEKISAAKIDVMPNMIDLSHFSATTPVARTEARHALGLTESTPLFVSVANLRPMKDHPTLFAAAERLVTRIPGAKFVILGEGPLENELKEQVEKLQLRGRVRFAGPQADVRPWLAAADLGIITSRSEGSSNALLEYMAAGLPTVVSNIPANRELAEGVFFEPGNPDSLANTLEKVWNDRALQARIRELHFEIVKTRSPEAIGRRVRSYYVQLAS